jgi:hypothetical protein
MQKQRGKNASKEKKSRGVAATRIEPTEPIDRSASKKMGVLRVRTRIDHHDYTFFASLPKTRNNTHFLSSSTPFHSRDREPRKNTTQPPSDSLANSIPIPPSPAPASRTGRNSRLPTLQLHIHTNRLSTRTPSTDANTKGGSRVPNSSSTH